MSGNIEVTTTGKVFDPAVEKIVRGAVFDGVVKLAELGEDLARDYWSGVSPKYADTIRTFKSEDKLFASAHSAVYWFGSGPPPFHPGRGLIGEAGVYVSTWLEEGRRRPAGRKGNADLKSVTTKKGLRSLYSARKARGWYRWRATFSAVGAVDRLDWFAGRVTEALE